MNQRPDVFPAVIVDGVAKTFRLPQDRTHTLKERALHPFRRASYEELEALKSISFGVQQGEFFGIVGRNGSGKSTLLKCMAGIYRADAGSISIAGRMSTFIELGVGFNPDLAALDNVMLNGIMLGLSPREARRRFDAVIEFAELEEFVDLKLKNYSSGMQVRLAFSVMVQADADILLVDEVLAVGDASFQQKCFDVFNHLRDAGKTIILVTHDMAAVTRFCHRAILLERGEMVAEGDPDEVATQYIELNFGGDRTESDAGDTPDTRPGDHKATIVEAWAENDAGERRATYLQGETIHVAARIEFRELVEDPIFNVAFVNEHRMNHLVLDSKIKSDRTGRFEAGDSVMLRGCFENRLGIGRYQVSVLVAHRGSGSKYIDLWEEIFSVVIAGARATGALVDLPFELEIDGRRLERSSG